MSPTGPIKARILYWGIEGAGKTTNLQAIHDKLRADHRGELRRVPTRLDSTVHYETLPIQLGEVGGVAMQIELLSVPGGAEQAPTRKQLLDQVSGIVLVLDAESGRFEENRNTCEELSHSLAAYGHTLADLPLVVQYNKRDLSDAFAIEELHRQLALPATAAVFEAVASEGTGVLQTLTTLSKRVVRTLRDRRSSDALKDAENDAPVSAGRSAPIYDPQALEDRAAQGPPVPASVDAPPSESVLTTRMLEDAIEAEIAEGAEGGDPALELDARAAFERPFDSTRKSPTEKPRSGLALGPGVRIVSIGSATRQGERAVRIPLVLGNDDGETATLALTIQLDPVLDADRDGED